jgi:hypothetical protein
MPNIIDCPRCGRKLRVHEDLSGSDVQCPSCRVVFAPGVGNGPLPFPDESGTSISSDATIPAAPPPRPSQAVPAGARSDPPPAGAATRRCPYCNEDIRCDAERCRFCGEELAHGGGLPPWERGAGRRDLEPDRGGMILGLGIIGLVCSVTCFLSVIGLPLCVTAWVMAQRDLSLMNAYEMDPSGKGNTVAGLICGIIGTIFSAFCLLITALGFLS